MLHDASNMKGNSSHSDENTRTLGFEGKEQNGRQHTQGRDFSKEEMHAMQKEMLDVKEKTKLITSKFATVRKERDALKKENQDLQNEILTLQNSMREMIPSGNNTSSSFPIHNEINNTVTDFLKGDCTDIFFDVLSLELNIEGVGYFYQSIFSQLVELTEKYFQPAFTGVMHTAKVERLDKPVVNVMKKLFQGNWKSILSTIFHKKEVQSVLNQIQCKLKLGNGTNKDINSKIESFIEKASEIILICYLSEPQLTVLTSSINTQVNYNAIKHESVDGFLKTKEDCVIVFPPVINEKGDTLVKAHVLPLNYEFP